VVIVVAACVLAGDMETTEPEGFVEGAVCCVNGFEELFDKDLIPNPRSACRSFGGRAILRERYLYAKICGDNAAPFPEGAAFGAATGIVCGCDMDGAII